MVYTSFPSTYKECFPFSLPSTSLIPKMPQGPGLKVMGVGESPSLTQTLSGGFRHPPCPLSNCFQRSNFMALCESEAAQSCPTLCDPVDCSPPGCSVHGILQARILEWVATPGDLPNPGIEPRSPALQADSLPSKPQGSPLRWG